MASLTAHLVESGGHGRLGFHPSCPVCCQERLFGSLSSDAVVSRRAQAALAGGVLALSVVGPPAALAQEPDRQLEGGAGAGTGQGGAETGSGAVQGPGSDSDLGAVPPTEVVPPTAPDLDPLTPPESGGDSVLDEVVPVDTAPIEAPSTRPGDSEPGGETSPGSSEPTPTPDPSQPDPELGVGDPSSPQEAPEPVEPRPDGADASEDSKPSPSKPSPSVKGDAESREQRGAPQPSTESRSLPQPPALEGPIAAAPQETTPPAPTAQPSAPAPAGNPAPGSEGHLLVVQPGDSLWSIATKLLGPDASPAEIARKVSRLWKLNAKRIGTGRPDLLFVGTKLRLR